MVTDARIGELKPDYSQSVAVVFINSVEWSFNANESVFDVPGFFESRMNE